MYFLTLKLVVLLFICLCMLVMYFLTLKLVVFVVYLPVYVGNVLRNFKASSFCCLSACVCW